MASKDGKESSKAESKDAADKKRRRVIKTQTATARSASPVEVRKVAIKPEAKQTLTAKQLIEYEEKEVDGRTPEGDVQEQKEACAAIQVAMKKIMDVKNSGSADTETLNELRIQATLEFVTLKRINRLSHIRCKKAREATNQAKQTIDQHHLQLQNLLYEVSHLQKEINKCLQFKSKDEDINMVSEEDFYKEAPEEISRPETTKHDLHQQTIARLEWELHQRKRLAEKLKETEDSRGGIAKEMKTRKDYLETLQPKLATILQSTKPVQDYLHMPFDEIKEQHRTAQFLPRPLYVLYMQVAAYKEACDTNLSVNIEGDVEVAKATGDAPQQEIEDESDSDKEEEEKQVKKRRRRQLEDRKNQKKLLVLKPHPLSVVVSAKCKDGSELQLSFNYLLNFGIVTVKVTLSVGADRPTSCISGGDLLSPELLLTCLYPDDIGNETPNPANSYYLARMGLGPFSKYVNEVGYPYLWAQWLSGLQFLTTTEDSSTCRSRVDSNLSMSYMEGTIKRLRERVRSRLSLQKQLVSLERCIITVNSEYQHLFPPKISAKLTLWKRSTYEDFVGVSYTKHVVECGLARESDLYFTGTAERGSAKMSFQVVVAPDYPEVAPVFATCVYWQQQRSSLNDEHIKDFETEVNYHYDELVTAKSRDQLLTNQLQKLMMCFDVYLETECETRGVDGPCEFGKEKMFTRIAKGPSRKKPYVYNSKMGFFYQRI